MYHTYNSQWARPPTRESLRSVVIQDIGENIACLQRGAGSAHQGPTLHVHARGIQISSKTTQ